MTENKPWYHHKEGGRDSGEVFQDAEYKRNREEAVFKLRELVQNIVSDWFYNTTEVDLEKIELRDEPAKDLASRLGNQLVVDIRYVKLDDVLALVKEAYAGLVFGVMNEEDEQIIKSN